MNVPLTTKPGFPRRIGSLPATDGIAIPGPTPIGLPPTNIYMMYAMHAQDMQATTVRVQVQVKKELDRLQGLVQQRGRRLSQSDLLAALLRYAARDPDRFIEESGSDPRRTWTSDQLAAWRSRLEPWGVKTDVSRLDQELYQDPHSASQPDP